MAVVQFYLIDIIYKIIDNSTAVLMYGRTTDNRQICVIDRNFQPYFYAILKKGADIESTRKQLEALSVEKGEDIFNITGTEIVNKKYYGKKVQVVKIYVNLPLALSVISKEVGNLEEIEGVYEHDTPYVRRYMIDKNIMPLTLLNLEGEYINMKSKVSVFNLEKVETASPPATISDFRILSFDIQTYNPQGKDVINESNPIIIVAFYANDMKKVITWKKFKTKLNYVEFVNDEKELLNRFREIVESYKPDIIAGYFSDSYDLTYVEARARANDIEMQLGLDYSDIRVIRGKKIKSQITGISHIDVYEFVKRVIARSLDVESYSLGEVSKELLDERKEELDIDILADIWDNKPEELEKFCKYSLNEANLTLKLMDKTLPIMVEMVKLVGLPLFNITRIGFSMLIEWYLIRQSTNFDEIVPNKPDYSEVLKRKRQTYKGAYVLEPVPGLYKNIAVFDYRSLYPSIISSHNIDLITLNCSCCENETKFVPLEGEKFWFCTKKKGFISSVIEELISRRMRIKEIIKDKSSLFLDARQESLKLLANSFYGYLGFFASRWYSLECVKSVTAYGRYYIQKVIGLAKKQGFNVIYSDTDSVFLTLGSKSRNDLTKFSESVNMELSGLMELDYEGFYKRGIFVPAKEKEVGAKKKYALLSENNVMKIRGFESVRRNISVIARETQRKILNIILKENNVKKAFDYFKDVITKLRNKEIPLEKVLIQTQLQKNLEDYGQISSHVAVAKRLKEQGINVRAGSIITYLIVEGKEKIRDRARLLQEVKGKDYDADYYINNQVVPAVEKIFNVFGFDVKELLEIKEQSKLKKFF